MRDLLRHFLTASKPNLSLLKYFTLHIEKVLPKNIFEDLTSYMYVGHKTLWKTLNGNLFPYFYAKKYFQDFLQYY